MSTLHPIAGDFHLAGEVQGRWAIYGELQSANQLTCICIAPLHRMYRGILQYKLYNKSKGIFFNI